MTRNECKKYSKEEKNAIALDEIVTLDFLNVEL